MLIEEITVKNIKMNKNDMVTEVQIINKNSFDTKCSNEIQNHEKIDDKFENKEKCEKDTNLEYMDELNDNIKYTEKGEQTKINTEVSDDTIKKQIIEYPKITFTSKLKSHCITLELDVTRHEALINNMIIQQHSPVELVILLKNIVSELKKININYIIQQVSKTDWITILRADRIFTLVNENKLYGFLNVKCCVDRFPEAMMKALSFSEPFPKNESREDDEN